MIPSSWSDMPGNLTRFYKIILTDVGSHIKLLFPEKFVRSFGNNLKDSIIVNVPSGLEWSINLKRDRGKVWLENGLPEFAKCYSISFGYLLVFEYKGDSKFEVLIFDPSSLEIDYPLASSDKLNLFKSTEVKKIVIDIDDSSSDDGFGHCKKKKIASPSSKASSNLRQVRAKEASKVIKDRAHALANDFKSKSPFFVHAIKESNVVGNGWPNVYIPKTFKEAYENWKNNDKLILQLGQRSWDVHCKIGSSQCRINGGWTVFVRDNLLNVGDVCVFELIDKSRKLFQVFISRAAKDTNCKGSERLPSVGSEADKASLIESVKAFKPKHPNFKVEIKESYLYGGSVTVPKEFISRHIIKDSCTVNLQLPDGRVWPVKCYINKMCAKFSAGWKKFSKENNLAAGDFCGFELVNQKLFNVVIFRVESS